LAMGFSVEFEAKLNAMNQEYVDHMGVENVVRQMIERNLEEFGDESMDQTELLKTMGFSEIGAARFSHFIDDSDTHLSFANWLDLYLEEMFAPKGPITVSNFPFQEEIVNSEFNHQCSPKLGGITLKLINFSSKYSLKNWVSEQTDPNRVHREINAGKIL
jgi:hypothetical protein